MASGRIRHGRSTPKDVRVWLDAIDAAMADAAAPPETKAEESKADGAQAAEPAEAKGAADDEAKTAAPAAEAKEAPPPEGAVEDKPAADAPAPAPGEEPEELDARTERKLHRAAKAVFGKGRKIRKKVKVVKSVHWRDKRPVSVGNWAVPEHLWKVQDVDEWDRDDLQAYFEKFVLTDGTITDEDRDKLRNKIKFLAKASTSDFHRPMRDCCVERRVNEAAADLACHRTQKLEDKCIVKRSEDQTFFIPQLNIEVAMKKLAMMGDGKTEREKLQAVEARRRAMGSRGSQGGAEEAKDDGLMSPISEGGRSDGSDPQSPISDVSEGEEGSRPGSRAPSLRSEGSRPASRAPSEGSRPRSRAESITDEIRQEIANSIDDESVAPETPVGKSNMDKFDEYLK